MLSQIIIKPFASFPITRKVLMSLLETTHSHILYVALSLFIFLNPISEKELGLWSSLYSLLIHLERKELFPTFDNPAIIILISVSSL